MSTALDEFMKEIKGYTADEISLILLDQRDLYSAEEIKVLEDALRSKKGNDEINENKNIQTVYNAIIKQENEKKAAEEERLRLVRAKERYEQKIANLKKNGYDKVYEFKVINIHDVDNGDVDTDRIERTLNDLALDGWYIKCAYTNEIGHNSSSYGGYGTNSTVDANILILERYKKI